MTPLAGVCKVTPSKPGDCEAYIPSYTFKNNKCEYFVYGGCGATQNIFSTQEECESKCMGGVTKALPITTTTQKVTADSKWNV